MRCILAAPNDPYLLANSFIMVSSLAQMERGGGREEVWPEHAEAVFRAGALAPAVAALRRFSTEVDVVVGAATVVQTLLSAGGAAAAAREARAAEALAACLPAGLRCVTDDGFCAFVVASTLGTLVRCDAASAAQAATPVTLSHVAQAVALYGDSYQDLALGGVLTLHRLVRAVPAIATDDAVGAIIAAQRRVLTFHKDHTAVQAGIWASTVALLEHDMRFAWLAGEHRLAVDAVRSLSRVEEGELPLEEDLCKAFELITSWYPRSCLTALEDGVVAALSSVITQGGAQSAKITKAACFALKTISIQLGPGLFKPDVLHGGQMPPLLVDLVAALRAHSGDLEVQTVGLTTMRHVCESLAQLAFKAGRPTPSELARRMVDTGALEVVVAALRTHTGTPAEGDSIWLARAGIDAIAIVCSGSCSAEVGILQPTVATRAAKGGVAAVLTAALACTAGTDAAENGLTTISLRFEAEMLLEALELKAASAPPPRACENCGTTEAPKLMLCGRCRNARFCGAECMRAAWPAHKAACKATVAQQAAAGGASDTKLARS